MDRGSGLGHRLGNVAAVVACACLAGCAGAPGATTGSIAGQPAQVANTPASRVEHLAWNSAWAKSCGFFFDAAKLKSQYLAYEASAGTPPDQVAKLGATYDRLQHSLAGIAEANTDQCTDARLEHIRAIIARYLGGDFSAQDSV